MADRIQATPRSSILGLFSDIVNLPLQYMNSPERTQQMQGAAQFLYGTGIPQTLERASYGDSLFTGSGGLGGTTRMRPETADALMNVAPFAPVAGRLASRAVRATEGMPVGMSIKDVGKNIFEDATKYHQKVPEIKSINVDKLKRMNSGEVADVSDEVAANMDFSKPIQVSVFSDGELRIVDGHHRVAAAKKLGIKSLPVELQSINAKGATLNKLAQESTYPQQAALDLAQARAALPIEQGGLGLPPNNTAMDRARAMGYETPVFHGTNADIKAFNVEGKGKTSGAGAFTTTNPVTAETYVSASGEGNILPLLLKKDNFLTTNARGKNWADIHTNLLSAKSQGKKYSLDDLSLDKNSATTTDELGMMAKELGLKGTEIKNVKDLGPNSHVMRAKEYLLDKYGIIPVGGWSNVTGKQFDEAQKAMKKFYESQKSDIYAVQDPSLLRSKFAAFDPKKANSPDILAGAIPLGAISQTEEGKQTRKELLEQLLNKQK